MSVMRFHAGYKSQAIRKSALAHVVGLRAENHRVNGGAVRREQTDRFAALAQFEAHMEVRPVG